MTQENMTFEAWANVFGSASGIYLVTNVFYFFMISGDIQKWNYNSEDESAEVEMSQSEKGKFIKVTKALEEDTTDI